MPNRPLPLRFYSHETRDQSRAVGALKTLPDIRTQSLAAVHLVMSLRLCALFDQAGREPVAELAQRFGSVTAACAVLHLAGTLVRCWPDRYQAARPCCRGMTPDEWTLAEMARAAENCDRAGFEAALAGYVRTDRHEVLFDAALRAVAALQAI